jgi:hypothetical protein
LAEPCRDALEPSLFGGDELALGLHARVQQLGYLVRITGLQDLGDLIEREAAVFERQNAR